MRAPLYVWEHFFDAIGFSKRDQYLTCHNVCIVSNDRARTEKSFRGCTRRANCRDYLDRSQGSRVAGVFEAYAFGYVRRKKHSSLAPSVASQREEEVFQFVLGSRCEWRPET